MAFIEDVREQNNIVPSKEDTEYKIEIATQTLERNIGHCPEFCVNSKTVI